jgi:predicted MFS family arabinose efflux permease
MSAGPPVEAGPALPEAERARGRRLAYASHPASMTHRTVYTSDLPTLALVSLGASETLVGLQRSFDHVGQLLQLPTLRAVGFARKRAILIAGQAVAVAGGLPLVAFPWLAGLGPAALPVALASFAVATAGIVVAQTVWFPLLRAYVEPERTGSFFGILRTGWHVVLILYFFGAQCWLAARPGAFGALFGIATLLGLARIGLVRRLPEAEGERGAPVRVGEALRSVLEDPRLRRYLVGVGLYGGARQAVVPFVVVWMRRVMGLSEAEVIWTTVAHFAGGLVSLLAWGRLVDRLGTAPVFRATALASSLLFAALCFIPETPALAPLVAFSFLLSVLASGFGVADTHRLFSITPARAPSRRLVVANVITSSVTGLAPFLAGLVLDRALAAGASPPSAYRGLFLAGALAAAGSALPLRR